PSSRVALDQSTPSSPPGAGTTSTQPEVGADERQPMATLPSPGRVTHGGSSNPAGSPCRTGHRGSVGPRASVAAALAAPYRSASSKHPEQANQATATSAAGRGR